MEIRTYKPEQLPLRRLRWENFLPLLGKAHEVLGEFNELLKQMEKPESTLAFLKTQESIFSVHPKQFRSVQEDLIKPDAVLNYQHALTYAQKSRKPFTNAFFLKIHRLLKATKSKDRGHFRKKQNWIGPIGSPIEEGRYFPPPASEVPRHLKQLQNYFSYPEKDVLVQAAIYFAQFLAIHPFMDGNGRVARVFLPVFFHRKKITLHPLFFMSDFFRRNYSAYYERLFRITEKHDWEGWIIFFLKGMSQEGERLCRKAEKLLKLEKKWAEELLKILPPKSCRELFDFIFANPICSSAMFSSHFHLSKALEKKLFRILQIQKKGGCCVCKNILHAVA